MASPISRFDTFQLLSVKLSKRSNLYNTKPQNLNDLRHQIFNETALILNEMIRENAVSGLYHQIEYCQEVNGKHFLN